MSTLDVKAQSEASARERPPSWRAAPPAPPLPPDSGVSATGYCTRMAWSSPQALNDPALAYPQLIVVSRGVLVVGSGAQEFRVGPSDIIVIPATVSYRLALTEGDCAMAGPVEFLIATFGADLFDRYSETLDRPVLDHLVVVANVPAEFYSSLRVDVPVSMYLQTFSTRLASHRMKELLIWSEQLTASTLCPSYLNLVKRVRALISTNVARAWSAPMAARSLGVPVATLKRTLLATETGFGDLLAEVRMAHARALIEASALPISGVAAAVGYSSQSRFAETFRRRYGVPPTGLRGHQRS